MTSENLDSSSPSTGSESDAHEVFQGDTAWRCEYPFRSHFMEVEGHKIHYLDECEPSATPKSNVLMVHGNPTWSFYWRRLIGSLRSEHRVIAVDHMGCGLSDKPQSYDYCLSKHISNLHHLVNQLDLTNITLVAHDWGGAIGLGTLLANREKFNRIILLNTGAFPPPYIPFRIRVCRWPIVGKIGVQGFNLFAKAATVMATEQKGGLPEPLAQGYLYPYDKWDNRIAVYQFVKDIPTNQRHRTWSVLKEIESGLVSVADWPIQLIWGMKDWCFRPECLHRFQSHWPDANVVELDQAGHYVLEDAPHEVEEAIQKFLAENSGDAAAIDD